jgi:hypothetical protein
VRAKISAKIDEAKKWLWLRKRIVAAALSFTATIALVLLSIDPTSRVEERAVYIVLALITFLFSIFLWLKQIEFVDEYVEEYEFMAFPIEEKEEPHPQPAAQPQPPKQPKPKQPKPWCPYCGSVRVIVRGKRIYCLDCGQIAREKVKGA